MSLQTKTKQNKKLPDLQNWSFRIRYRYVSFPEKPVLPGIRRVLSPAEEADVGYINDRQNRTSRNLY